jgi:hypothetical protein
MTTTATIERTSRHENRLGETDRGKALADVAQGVERTATGDVPAAGEALRAENAAQGKHAVEKARDAIDANIDALDAASGASPAPRNAAQSGEPGQQGNQTAPAPGSF